MLQVDEDEVLALVPDAVDAAGDRGLLFQPLSLGGDGSVLLDKFWDGLCDVELVGVGVGLLGFFEFDDHLRPILEVLCGVEDLFGFGGLGCGFVLQLLCLLCGLLCLLGLELLELLEALLFVLAQLGALGGALGGHLCGLLLLGGFGVVLWLLSLHN